ncbi:MAG: phosphotransferase, partial [Oscillochloris sp.]|nr:phosphotransferase [Oscillochloris sp.]
MFDTGSVLPLHGMPAAEWPINHTLVSGLLADQHPNLTGLPLQEIAAGWDNVIFRLGARWLIRLPRRAAAAPLAVHEQLWLPRLAPQLTLPIPVPYRIGMPGRGYPWRWSVVPWISGITADLDVPTGAQAQPFAAFLRSLHRPAPADAPLNPFRGVPLAERVAVVEERMRRLANKTDLITPQIWRVWEAAHPAPPP